MHSAGFARDSAMFHNPLLPSGVQAGVPSFASWGTQPVARSANDPSTRTQQPIVTGTGVLAIKFNGGVMMASDTLGSYGSLARFRDVQRIKKFGDYTLIGASGDLSDFQRITSLVSELDTLDACNDDGCSLTPRDIHQYLGRVMYNRRNKFDPLWNELVVAGFRDGKPFLGAVDLIGTMYEDDVVATSFGSYVCLPLLRKAGNNLSRDQAKKVLEDCLRVLFYRNTKASTRIQIACVTAAGVEIEEPFHVSTYWGYEGFKHTEYHGQNK
jgi:20S proteasome subunit beta 7